jgi:predicted DNA-binding protein (MmcQ/YjbR family)
MTLERLRTICLALPGATEQIQWGADLVFKVGGRMFCVASTDVAPVDASPRAPRRRANERPDHA